MCAITDTLMAEYKVDSAVLAIRCFEGEFTGTKKKMSAIEAAFVANWKAENLRETNERVMDSNDSIRTINWDIVENTAIYGANGMHFVFKIKEGEAKLDLCFKVIDDTTGLFEFELSGANVDIQSAQALADYTAALKIANNLIKSAKLQINNRDNGESNEW